MPRKQFNKTFTNKIATLTELCTDPITLLPFVNPYAIQCGHTVEKDSLDEWMKHQCVCPVCQTPITIPPVPNYLMRQILPVINDITKTWQERTAVNSNLIISRLLCKNADVNVPDKKGETPLHRTARQGSISLTQQWLKLEEKKKSNNTRTCGTSRVCGQ